jgi:hypothetical protein
MVQALRHPIHGFHAVEIHTVVQHIKQRYGRLTPALFAALKEYLRNPIRLEMISIDSFLEPHDPSSSEGSYLVGYLGA